MLPTDVVLLVVVVVPPAPPALAPAELQGNFARVPASFIVDSTGCHFRHPGYRSRARRVAIEGPGGGAASG